jgi:putative peptidoglycan lipid II flippase
LGEGALTAAFIPIFKAKEKTAGEVEMWRSANAVISALLVSAAVVVALVLLGLSLVLAWKTLPESTRLMLQLLRIMFPYMLLVCLAAAWMGMLNARGFFFIPAFGAAMLNVVMIASVLFLAPRFGDQLETQIFALAVGVLVAGIAQAGFQAPALGPGLSLSLGQSLARSHRARGHPQNAPRLRGRRRFPNQRAAHPDPGLRRPRAHRRELQLRRPAHGVSPGVCSASPWPLFSCPRSPPMRLRKTTTASAGRLREGLSYLLFLNLLAAALLAALAEPMVRLLFEYGLFDRTSTAEVALAVTLLAPGLVAFSAVNIIARAFFALGDTTTPMRISVFTLAVNFMFAALFLLALRLGAAGLALANTLSSTMNLCLLLYALRRKLKRLDLEPLRATFAASLALPPSPAWSPGAPGAVGKRPGGIRPSCCAPGRSSSR